jgi:hypothetical protein
MWFVEKVPGCFMDSVGALNRAAVHATPVGNASELCLNIGNFDFYGGDIVQLVVDRVGTCCAKCAAESRCFR